MAAFHYFPRLPAELRALIWDMTAEPRIVEVHLRPDPHHTEGTHLYSPTPAPAMVQACHESREHAARTGLYRRAFTFGSDPRYTWVNFTADTVSVGFPGREFQHLGADLAHIQSLRLECENDDLFFFQYSEAISSNFISLRRLQFICVDGVDAWEDVWRFRSFGPNCPTNNVTFIDKSTGLMLDGLLMRELLYFNYLDALDPAYLSVID
ncbi:hypothetical protein GMORB2_0813 [Geosmithia morbida]|uniref:2EXR domain-containing protein n=1 Tax=Geosmithia morbida TaxID=1094350 RepID=A0A9P5D8I8_9HYPO|nr:uncharacterized protein GMORB2_0813 [Geosmithia morbida]KAF4125569.1 hypothetical protein GMORB2_0813 [Geosmithia morbida]